MAVSGGLYALLTQGAAGAAVQAILAAPATSSLHFTLAAKQAKRPYVVLHILDAPPAEHSQSGPSSLIDGEFQFDSYADDQPTARKLSQAVRDALANYSGTLNDGTGIQFYEVSLDTDDAYELGGGGYVFRSVLRLRAFYIEAGSFFPSGETDMIPSLIFHKVSAAGDNAQNIKASAGVVTGWKVYNNTGYPVFVKLYDKASTPVPASDSPRQVIGVDAGESDVNPPSAGVTYVNGIGIAIVRNIADNDDTAVALNDCVVDIFYQ